MLILGGGNGEILPFLFENFPQLELDYVEASSKMIKMAKKNSHQNQRVHFVHTDKIPASNYNSVYCAFFLDCLTKSEILQLTYRFNRIGSEGQKFYVIDFYKVSSIFQSLKLKLSIVFFRLTTQHPNKHLIDVFDVFEYSGYKSLDSCYLENGLLRASYMDMQM